MRGRYTNLLASLVATQGIASDAHANDEADRIGNIVWIADGSELELGLGDKAERLRLDLGEVPPGCPRPATLAVLSKMSIPDVDGGWLRVELLPPNRYDRKCERSSRSLSELYHDYGLEFTAMRRAVVPKPDAPTAPSGAKGSLKRLGSGEPPERPHGPNPFEDIAALDDREFQHIPRGTHVYLVGAHFAVGMTRRAIVVGPESRGLRRGHRCERVGQFQLCFRNQDVQKPSPGK